MNFGQIGLILDILGVISLFYSATENAFLDILKHTRFIDLEKGKKAFDWKNWNKYQIASFSGLILIIVGFLLQFYQTFQK